MKPTLITAGLAIGFLAGGSVQAADTGLTLSVGTTGLGLHLTKELQPKLNGRIGVNLGTYDYASSTSDVDYDFKLKLRTFDALLDYFPNETEFRVSGGLVYNSNRIDATGKPSATGSYRVNGNVYASGSAGQLDGTIDFRKFAPYVGIGWGNPVRKLPGWNFSADLGVMFQGSSRTSLTNTGCTAPAPACTQLAADVAAENIRLQDKTDNLKLYPVFRVGASYRF